MANGDAEAIAKEAARQNERRAQLREWSCSILALAGFGLFLFSVGLAIHEGANNDASKFYLMIADKLMVLVGAIFGYYFGRNPAERAADAARNAETAAKAQAAGAKSEAEQAKRTSRELAGAFLSYAPPPTGGGSADPRLVELHQRAQHVMAE